MPLFNFISALWDPFKSTTGTLPSSPAFKLRIYESEYRKIEAFVLRFKNIETGGDLFGLWTRDGQPVIQLIIGPGEKCKRTSVSFHQDVNYLQNVGGSLNTSFMLCHMGSWHSHHQLSLTHPSSGDHSTVRNNFPAGLERYIMVIANIVDGTYYGKRVELHPYVFSCEGRICEEGEVEMFPCSSPFGEIDFVISKIVNGAEKTQGTSNSVARASQDPARVSQNPARYSQNRTEKSRFQELPSLPSYEVAKSPPSSSKHRIPKDVTEQWYTLPEGEKKLKEINEEIMEMVQMESAQQNGEPGVSFICHQKSRDLTMKFVHCDKTWCIEFPRSFDEEEAKIYFLQNSQKSDCIPPARNVIESVRLFCGCPNCDVLMNCRKEMKNGHGTEEMDISDESNDEEPRATSSSVEESDVINDESTTAGSDGDTREVNKGTQQWYKTLQGQEKLKEIFKDMSNLKPISNIDTSRNKESQDFMLSFFYNHRKWTIDFPRFYDKEAARIQFVTEGLENSSSSNPVFSTDIINAVQELCSSAEYDLQEYVEKDKTTDQQLGNRENVSDTRDDQELRKMSHESNVNQEDKTADMRLAIRGNIGDTRDESDDHKRRRMSHDSNVNQQSVTGEDETTDELLGIRWNIGDTMEVQERGRMSHDSNLNQWPDTEDETTDELLGIRWNIGDTREVQERGRMSHDSNLNQWPDTEEDEATDKQQDIRENNSDTREDQERRRINSDNNVKQSSDTEEDERTDKHSGIREYIGDTRKDQERTSISSDINFNPCHSKEDKITDQQLEIRDEDKNRHGNQESESKSSDSILNQRPGTEENKTTNERVGIRDKDTSKLGGQELTGLCYDENPDKWYSKEEDETDGDYMQTIHGSLLESTNTSDDGNVDQNSRSESNFDSSDWTQDPLNYSQGVVHGSAHEISFEMDHVNFLNLISDEGTEQWNKTLQEIFKENEITGKKLDIKENVSDTRKNQELTSISSDINFNSSKEDKTTDQQLEIRDENEDELNRHVNQELESKSSDSILNQRPGTEENKTTNERVGIRDKDTSKLGGQELTGLCYDENPDKWYSKEEDETDGDYMQTIHGSLLESTNTSDDGNVDQNSRSESNFDSSDWTQDPLNYSQGVVHGSAHEISFEMDHVNFLNLISDEGTEQWNKTLQEIFKENEITGKKLDIKENVSDTRKNQELTSISSDINFNSSKEDKTTDQQLEIRDENEDELNRHVNQELESKSSDSILNQRPGTEENKTTNERVGIRDKDTSKLGGQELTGLCYDENPDKWYSKEEDETDGDYMQTIHGSLLESTNTSDDGNVDQNSRSESNFDSSDWTQDPLNYSQGVVHGSAHEISFEMDHVNFLNLISDEGTEQWNKTLQEIFKENEITGKKLDIKENVSDTRKNQELTSISSDINFNSSKEDKTTDQQLEIRDENEDELNRHVNQELESKSSDSILNESRGTEEDKMTNEQVGIRVKDTSKLGSQELTGLWRSKEEDETDGDYMQTIRGDLLESTNTSYKIETRSESNFDSSWSQYPLNLVLNNSQGVVNRSAHETSFESADVNTVDFTERETQQWYETLQCQEKFNEIHEDIVSKLKPTSDVEWSRGNESHDLILSFLYNHRKWTVHFPRSYDEEYAIIDFVTHGIQNLSSSGSVFSKDIVNDIRELCSREKYDVEEYDVEEYEYSEQGHVLTQTVTTIYHPIYHPVTQLPNQPITKVRQIPVRLEDESLCDSGLIPKTKVSPDLSVSVRDPEESGMRSKVKYESEFTTQRTAENTNETLPVGDDAQWYRNTDFSSSDYDSDLSKSSFSSEKSGTRGKVKRESEIATQTTAENTNETLPVGDDAQWYRNTDFSSSDYDSDLSKSSFSSEKSGMRSKVKYESEFTTQRTAENTNETLPVGDDAQWYRNTDFPLSDYDSDLSESSFSSEKSGTRGKVKRESEIATQRTAENGNEIRIGDNAQWCRNSYFPLTNYDSHMLESSLSPEVSGTRSNVKCESENTTLKSPQNADKSLIESQVEISGGTTDPAETDTRRNNLKIPRAAIIQSLSSPEKREQRLKMAFKLRRFFKLPNEGVLEEVTNPLNFNHGKIDWLIEFRPNFPQSKLYKRENNGRSFCADVLPKNVVEVLKNYCGCGRCILPSSDSSAVVPAVSISPAAVPPAISSAAELSPAFSRFSPTVISPAVPSKVSPAFSVTKVSPVVSPKAPPAFSLVKVSPTGLSSFSSIVSKTATPSRSRNRRCKTSSRKFSQNI